MANAVKVRIEVTEEDIRQGKPGDSLKCPVARALLRTVHKKVFVGQAGWFVFPDDSWGVSSGPDSLAGMKTLGGGRGRFASQPHTVHQFVARFDEGREVTPFSFDLEVPSSVGGVA